MKRFCTGEVRNMKKFRIVSILGAATVAVLSYLVKEEKKNEVKEKMNEVK